MKRGLQHAPALPMLRLFAREQPVADEFAQQLCSRIAFKAVLPGHQNFFNQLRIVHQVKALVQNAKRRYRAILARRAFQKLDCPRSLAFAQKPERIQPARSRRNIHASIFARNQGR